MSSSDEYLRYVPEGVPSAADDKQRGPLTAEDLRKLSRSTVQRVKENIMDNIESRCSKQILDAAEHGQFSTMVAIPLSMCNDPHYDVDKVAKVMSIRLSNRGYDVSEGYESYKIEVDWSQEGLPEYEESMAQSHHAVAASTVRNIAKEHTRVKEEILVEVTKRWDSELEMVARRNGTNTVLRVPQSMVGMPHYSLPEVAERMRERLIKRGFTAEPHIHEHELHVTW